MVDVDDAVVRAATRTVAATKRPACSASSTTDMTALRSALAARAREVRADPQRRARYDLPVVKTPSRAPSSTDNPFGGAAPERPLLDKPKPTPTLVLPVRVSLQEINEGATVTVNASVRVPASPGGDATNLVDTTFTVNVEPGALSGTRYLVPKGGHQDPGRPPGDVELLLEALPHPRFAREDDHPADLVQAETVSLREALLGCTVEILTLDDRLIRVAITDIVRPGYEKRLSGEGLPRVGGGREGGRGRGDLVLRLDVRFPTSLPRPCKALLDQALRLADGHRDDGVDGDVGDGVARAVLEDKMRRQTER